jgi:hypothetical protein
VAEQNQPHILVIQQDLKVTDWYEPTFTIECPGITDVCRTWFDCDKCTADDRDALHEADQPIAHGVEHKLFSWGWSVPSDDQCFVRDNDGDAVVNLVHDLPPGRYEVAFDVDDETDLILSVVDVQPAGGVL